MTVSKISYCSRFPLDWCQRLVQEARFQLRVSQSATFHTYPPWGVVVVTRRNVNLASPDVLFATDHIFKQQNSKEVKKNYFLSLFLSNVKNSLSVHL